MKKNIQIMICIAAIAIIASLAIVRADYWECFNKGAKINFCGFVKDRVSPSDGFSLCMKAYNESGKCHESGSYPKCLQLPQTCQGSHGNSTIDSEPPVLTIHNPVENRIYNSKSVFFSLNLDELGSVYYTDTINGRGRWTKVCSGCDHYTGLRSFDEGTNRLTFRASDLSGHDSYLNLSFIIDSKAPQIHKTLPESRFANGEFSVQYSENNIKSIKLLYGNILSGFSSKEVPASVCGSGKKKWCDIDVSLASYEGESIEYRFVIEDIAGNVKESKKINLEVDNTFPVLNNPDTYWKQGNGTNSRYVYFLFNVTEKNFGKIYYSYTDARGTEKDKTLCSSLKNGMCSKKEQFGKGSHAIVINIVDKAGNMISKGISFVVN